MEATLPALNTIQEAYETACLAGHRFPEPDDAELWRRCKATWCFREWIELYRRYHMVNFAEATRLVIDCRLNKHFGPLVPLKPELITRNVLLHFATELAKHSPTVARMSLKLITAIFYKAIDWGVWSGQNPASRIPKPPRQFRTRFVQPGEELRRLLVVLNQEPDDIRAFFLTVLLTGCRKGELQRMQWKDLDLVNGLWHKPAGTVKNRKPQTTPLPRTLIPFLDRLPRLNTWVFEAPHNLGRWKEMYVFNTWKRIRTRAHLPDCTIHDLRRTFASYLAMGGTSASVIAKALGHSDLQHVHIYARLDVNSVRSAVDAQADTIMNLHNMTPPPTAGPRPTEPHPRREPTRQKPSAEPVEKPPAAPPPHAREQAMDWPG